MTSSAAPRGRSRRGRPDAAKPRNVQELLTAPETGLHPRVVGSQVASSTGAGEGAATRVDRAEVADQIGQVAGERDRFAGVLVVGHDTRQPRLHRPRKRVVGPGFTERDRLGRGEARTARQLAGRFRFGLQPAPRRLDLCGLQRESSREPIADAEEGVCMAEASASRCSTATRLITGRPDSPGPARLTSHDRVGSVHGATVDLPEIRSAAGIGARQSDLMSERGLDHEGTIAREGALDRVPAAFVPVVDGARAHITETFDGTRLHSAYIYGSIPRGTAIPGVSDLDLQLALHHEPTEADRADAEAVEAALDLRSRRSTASASC